MNQMKQVFFLFLCLVFAAKARAQLVMPLSVITTSGGFGSFTMSGTQPNVEWTLGEAIIGYGQVGNSYLTLGEQQPLQIWALGLPETANHTIRVYPNPAQQMFHIEGMPSGDKQIMLYDITGRLVYTQSTSLNVVPVSITAIESGNYLLFILFSTNQKQSFKISIQKN